MLYQRVCLEALAYTLPDEVVTSDEIEARLEPLYSRLKLPAGRLELMSGIRERRFWPSGSRPSTHSIASCQKLLAQSDIDRAEIGALVHASVCRDYLEPATACRVHHALDLPAECQIFDVSNACLGILNGILTVANMIELGQIRAGLVVGSEDCRPLVETTINWLNREQPLTRETVKPAMASLTIGSASCAVLLCDRRLSRTQNRLLAASARANTQFNELCSGGEGEAIAGGGGPLMQTNAEALLEAGIATGKETFASFLAEVGWDRDQIDRTVCHQIGSIHRRRMLEALRLDPVRDFTSFEVLGNTGSVALPITLALAVERGLLSSGDQVALLGIGSGINSLMLGIQWQHAPVTTGEAAAPAIAGAK